MHEESAIEKDFIINRQSPAIDITSAPTKISYRGYLRMYVETGRDDE